VPNVLTIKTVGQWDKRMEVPLTSAIDAMIDLFGKSAEKVCRTALWYMAESATKLTKIAKKKREVVKNPSFTHLIKKIQYKKIAIEEGREALKPYFRWVAIKLMQGGKWKPIFANDKDSYQSSKTVV
jgi:hypothetical protein